MEFDYIYPRENGVLNVRLVRNRDIAKLISDGWLFKTMIAQEDVEEIGRETLLHMVKKRLPTANIGVSPEGFALSTRVQADVVESVFELIADVEEFGTSFAEFCFESADEPARRIVYYPHEDDFYLYGFTQAQLEDVN